MVDPILRVKGATKHFGALVACDHVDFDLKPGEIHAVIGPNGAGKSTFIKLVAGEHVPNSGEFQFCGENIGALSAAQRAKAGLARTFQVSSVVNEFNALQNVLLAVQGASGETFSFFKSAMRDDELMGPATKFLMRAGLEDRSSVLASDLSHGERRQLEIAMALAMEPKVFLLDEPMAGIGPGGSKVLTDILDQLRIEAPILLVEHDMQVVFSLADRITVLVEGRNFVTGSAEDVRKNPDVKKAYLGEVVPE